MSTFDELKQKAETQVAADKAATQNWIKSHRAWLIAIGMAAVLGAILVKACGG